MVKVNFSRYRPGVAQRVDRGIALLFHDRGTRKGWVVSSTPRLHFTPGKDPVPILQEAGWAPGKVWTGGKSRLHRDSIPYRPAYSQSLYQLSYPAHGVLVVDKTWVWSIGRLIMTGTNQSTPRKSCPSAALLPHIPHRLTWDCTQSPQQQVRD